MNRVTLHYCVVILPHDSSRCGDPFAPSRLTTIDLRLPTILKLGWGIVLGRSDIAYARCTHIVCASSVGSLVDMEECRYFLCYLRIFLL